MSLSFGFFDGYWMDVNPVALPGAPGSFFGAAQMCALRDIRNV
jgi:hypothetical protein